MEVFEAMEEAEFLGLIAENLEVAPGTVSLADKLDEIGWDSLANLGLIAEIDTRLRITLDADEIAKSETVADLFDIIGSAKPVG